MFIENFLILSSIIERTTKIKKYKWNIKFWMLCDATLKYCINFYCYRDVKLKINNKIKWEKFDYNIINIVINLSWQNN